MRVHLFSFFLLVILVISGCALDYNDYPYGEDPQAVPVSTVTEEPATTVSEDISVAATEETTIAVPDSATSTESVESTSVDSVDTSQTAPQETSVVETQAEPSVTEVSEPQTVTFDVTASQFSFTPSTLTVRKGDTVVINLSTVDVPHGFAVTDFNFSLSATTPGQVVSGSFVPDQAGTFTFFCNVSCGTGHSSMKGTLVVTE